jgi:hypothetical protein
LLESRTTSSWSVCSQFWWCKTISVFLEKRHNRHVSLFCVLIPRISENIRRVLFYQRGPRGGGTSIAANPLMHWVASPSPIFRMYWATEIKSETKSVYWK